MMQIVNEGEDETGRDRKKEKNEKKGRPNLQRLGWRETEVARYNKEYDEVWPLLNIYKMVAGYKQNGVSGDSPPPYTRLARKTMISI